MSCLPLPATFRLLDPLVGWDPDSVEGIGGLDLASGLQLAFVGGSGGVVPADDVSGWLAPAALARGCAPCEWLLVTPCPPASRLLRKDICAPCFAEAEPGAVGVLRCAVAVATAGRNVAVADVEQNAVLLFADHGRRLVTKVGFANPGPLAYAPWQEWLVVDAAHKRIACLDLAGFAGGHLRPELPGPVDRMAVDGEERIWLAIEEAPLDDRQQVSLWFAARADAAFTRATFDDLQRAFEPNGITVTNPRGFCFTATDAAWRDEKTGQLVEIRPLFDPSGIAIGSDIPVVTYADGGRAKNARVIATHIASGEKQEVRTNSSAIGQFCFQASRSSGAR